MPDLYRNQLGAYLDGELGDHRLMELQAHLDTCQECREELEALRNLSQMLHASPDPEFTPARLFTARLMLQIPRRDQTQASSKSFLFVKWLTPAVLLLSLIFIQVTSSLSTFITLVSRAGLLGNTAEWLPATPQQTEWFAATQAAFGGFMNLQGNGALRFINDLALWVQNLDGSLLWQAALIVLYCTWLMIWWKNRQSQNNERQRAN
jgi:hypothetical protein